MYSICAQETRGRVIFRSLRSPPTDRERFMSDSSGFLSELEGAARQRVEDFDNPRQEWRRLASELVGTFLLVIVAAGAPMVGHLYSDTVTLEMAVIAPGLMVMAIILFMGKVSGAHLNPAVSLAFAARGDFPWHRVPGYVIAQVLGAIAAALTLTAIVGVSASNGGSYPGASTSPLTAMFVEMLLTFALVSVILGTASGAQSVGVFAAIAVGGYIVLAGLWATPVGGIHEPRAHARAQSRRRRPGALLGLPHRSDPRRPARRGLRLHPARQGRQGWTHGGPGSPRSRRQRRG